MITDTDLEAALRATFTERAALVTDGPYRRAAGLAGDGDVVDFTEMTPPAGRPRPGRWRVPLLAAAAVAVVAVIASGAITDGFGAVRTVDTAGVPGSTVTGAAAPEPDGAQTTATVDAAGVITISRGDPDLVLDVYADALCPICMEFEGEYGAQISQAVDAELVAVRYRMVDFLNAASASGDYSTRAYAALISVATHDGDRPDVFAQFYAALFSAAHQPEEQGASDLSDSDLAALAAGVGASQTAQQDIVSGAAMDAATADARRNLASLTATAASVGRAPGTPTVAVDGIPVSTNTPDWLADLLADGADAPGGTQLNGG